MNSILGFLEASRYLAKINKACSVSKGCLFTNTKTLHRQCSAQDI